MDTSVTSGGNIDNGVTLTSANTTSVSKKHQTILLQTAHAIAHAGPDGPSIPVRVLFDNGSQLSYATNITATVRSQACKDRETLFEHIWTQ